MVCVPLIPPQPIVATNAKPASARRSIFQFIFTMAVWRQEFMGATIKSPIHLAVLAALIQSLMMPAMWAATDFAGEAKAIYESARRAQATNASDFKATLQLSIAAFDFAEFAKKDEAREAIADVGIKTSRQAVALDPKSAAAHYYLALNLGQLARTKMLGALKLINEMEREFKTSIELDQKFDYAGALRALGALYMETPSWSIGSKTKARANFEKALELAPNYPDNYLTFMEALLNWKDRETLAAKMTAYAELLPKAKKEFSGHEWEWEWTDWDKRWAALQAKSKRK
jgi:tetratricopeptide (TPR) repeat protein